MRRIDIEDYENVDESKYEIFSGPEDEKSKTPKKPLISKEGLRNIIIVIVILFILFITCPFTYPLLKKVLPEDALPATIWPVEFMENIYGININDGSLKRQVENFVNEKYEINDLDAIKERLRSYGFKEETIEEYIKDKNKVIEVMLKFETLKEETNELISEYIEKKDITSQQTKLRQYGYSNLKIEEILNSKEDTIFYVLKGEARKQEVTEFVESSTKSEIEKYLSKIGYTEEEIKEITNKSNETIVEKILKKEQETNRRIEIDEYVSDLLDRNEEDEIVKLLFNYEYDHDDVDKIIEDKEKIIEAILKRENAEYKYDEIREKYKNQYEANKFDEIKEILAEFGYEEDEIDKILQIERKALDATVNNFRYEDKKEEIFNKIDEKYAINDTDNLVIMLVDYGVTKTEAEELVQDINKYKEKIIEELKKIYRVAPDGLYDVDDPTGTGELVNGSVFNIIFDNLKVDSSNNSTDVPKLVSRQSLRFDITLKEPGDVYSFTIDIKNNGKYNVKIDKFLTTILSTEQEKYMTYTMTYEDGTEIQKNDKLKSGDTVTLKFTAIYKEVFKPEDLPKKDLVVNYFCQIVYIQDDNW